MPGVEDTVRRALRVQVEHQPPMADPAGHAIAAATAVRRRQLVAGAVAGAVGLVLAIGGLAALREHRTDRIGPTVVPSTTPTAATPPPAPTATGPGEHRTAVDVSVIVDRNTLVTGDGRKISLDRVPGGAISGYRTGDGWLIDGYGTGDSSLSLWLVRPDGSLHPIITDATAPVAVAPDGRRLAWRSGSMMYTGHITASGLAIDHRTGMGDPGTVIGDRGHPLVYTGTAVYLGATLTGGGIDFKDVWLPDRGGYVQSSGNADIQSVFGVAPDGRNLLGLVDRSAGGNKRYCLALLDPTANLEAVRTACGVPWIVNPFGPVSPDGHWLAVTAPGTAGSSVAVGLIDLTTVFDTPKLAATWEVPGPGVWLDATTMIATGRDGRLVQLRAGTDGTGATGEPVTVPGLPASATVNGFDATLLPPLP